VGTVHIVLNVEYWRSSDKPFEWAVEEEDFVLIKYTLQEAAFIAERGTVTGTPVGCACGEGVLDWDRIVKTVREKCPRDIVFSVECGTPEQAARSLEHLGGFF